jgi:hypothetical protein
MPHRRNGSRVALIALAMLLSEAAAAGDAKETSLPALASVRVRNPTTWAGPAVVEVPVGHLALPGRIDWAKVRLAADDGREVPFAIREGRPHWKGRLVAPATTPRAEDLLVFACAPRRDAWSRIDVVAGTRRDPSAIEEHSGRILVSYPDFQVALQAATGMVSQIVAFMEPLLDGPLAITFQKTAGEAGAKTSGPLPRVRLVGKSSTAAMTEFTSCSMGTTGWQSG